MDLGQKGGGTYVLEINRIGPRLKTYGNIFFIGARIYTTSPDASSSFIPIRVVQTIFTYGASKNKINE